MFFKPLVEEKLTEKIKTISSISGGDINDVYKIKTEQNTYVLKVNRNDIFPQMFVKEKLGLEILSNTGIKSPKVIQCFSANDYQFLLLEFIKEGSITNLFWRNFASNLVTLHRTNRNYFGLNHNNYIGSLKQNNLKKTSWESFFIDCRIAPLIKLAFGSNLLNKSHLKYFEKLYLRLNELLPIENSSLVHGDLWSGNLMKGKDQVPIFIDPAVYYGHREMDIAMTRMFGGFDCSFINYYNDLFPLEKNWEDRIEIHNLYPNLVHLNLFGKSYLNGIESVIKKF
ncbi:MAG: fructosamine kinase family protein [Flavobacteriaceae bacterium]|nr:fructosamine kinase family protein [Flavobacteriaceae bacterium]